LATPEGLQAKNERVQAAKINEDPTWCHESDDNLAACRKFCDSTSLCEV